MGAAQYDGVPSPDLVARLQDADSPCGTAKSPRPSSSRAPRRRATSTPRPRPRPRGSSAHGDAAGRHRRGRRATTRGRTSPLAADGPAPAGPRPRCSSSPTGSTRTGAWPSPPTSALQAWPVPGHQLAHHGMVDRAVLRQGDGRGGTGTGRRVLTPARGWGSLRGHPFGGGVIGNTAGSGPVIGGSSPPPRAQFPSGSSGPCHGEGPGGTVRAGSTQGALRGLSRRGRGCRPADRTRLFG